MKHLKKAFAIACTGIAFTGLPATAQDCPSDAADNFDLDGEAVQALYSCIEGAMADAYAKNDDPSAKEYRNWTVSSTRPAVAGPHGERFLQTFANDLAAEQYLKFAYEDVDMPVGSVLAKESFNIRKGKAVVGPLFLMTKVGVDNAPETDGWLYGAVQPNGKTMGFKQSFCHDCHAAWEAQDYLAYPLEEVRVAAE